MLKQVLLVLLPYALVTVNGQLPCLGAPENPHSFAASPISCAHYTICMNGETITGENLVCPPAMLFDPKSESCGQTSCLECSSFGLQNLPHPDDCSQFVECIMGHRELRSCPNGLIFDRTIGNCNLREDTVCPSDPPDFETTLSPWEPPTTLPPWETPTTLPPWETPTTLPPWETPTTLPPTTPPGGVAPVCREGGQVHHAHPTDCTRFFICVGTVMWPMECPSKLHWNQVRNTCDVPESAGCLSNPTGPPGGTQPPWTSEPTLFPPTDTTTSTTPCPETTWSPVEVEMEPESPSLSDIVEEYVDAEPVPEN